MGLGATTTTIEAIVSWLDSGSVDKTPILETTANVFTCKTV